jgi:hypothetical protein
MDRLNDLDGTKALILLLGGRDSQNRSAIGAVSPTPFNPLTDFRTEIETAYILTPDINRVKAILSIQDRPFGVYPESAA